MRNKNLDLMLFLYYLFGTSMHKIKYHSYSLLTGKYKKKTNAMLVNRHFDNLGLLSRIIVSL